MEFREYLVNECHIQEKKIPYFINWVCIFKRYGEKQDLFLAFIKKTYQDWQVSQALTAVQMYKSYLHNQDAGTVQKTKPLITSSQDIGVTLKKGREVIRLHGLSYRTEKTYLQWLKRFLIFIEPITFQPITESNLKAYLTNLAVKEEVSSSTQTQAFNALLFFYRNIFNVPIKDLNNVIRSRKKQRLPVVLQKQEIQSIFSHLADEYLLICKIIYGGGLRLNEALSLRIKDIDFENRIITVRSGKGDRDRMTILAESAVSMLKDQINDIRKIYDDDRVEGLPGVAMPNAVGKKYQKAGASWSWFWIFPSKRISIDPYSRIQRRHHLHDSAVQKAFHSALGKTNIVKRASVHTLRHSFATHLIEAGYDIRTIQELLGHTNVKTTMIYTHIASRNKLSVQSPLDIISSSRNGNF
jgi:integron integrase